MSRVILALVGVVLLAVMALALIWLLGQLLVGIGAFVVGTAGVLSRLLWFLVFTGLLSGLVYFVASAWRPAGTPAPKPSSVRLDTAATAFAPPGPEPTPEPASRPRAAGSTDTERPAPELP